jgi:hypothetical protein
LMHLPRIARTIQLLIQIYWLMMKHPLVSTVSAVWYCSWYPRGRPWQSSEWK